MRTVLVFQGDKKFKLTLQDEDLITFGPWSPPTEKGWHGDGSKASGTLRIYRGKKDNIIGIFSGVTSFRDEALNYAEQVATEEVTTVWKSDHEGYYSETKGKKGAEWLDDTVLIGPPTNDATKRRKSKSG